MEDNKARTIITGNRGNIAIGNSGQTSQSIVDKTLHVASLSQSVLAPSRGGGKSYAMEDVEKVMACLEKLGAGTATIKRLSDVSTKVINSGGSEGE